MVFVLALAVVLATLTASATAISPIRMQDIQVLSFYKDGYTGTLRGQAIPQMTLSTRGVPDDVIPEEIVCTNMGWDGLNVHWDCKANLKESWSMHNTVISCEGWSHPGDEYVVPGSCAINYELKRDPVKKQEKVVEEPRRDNYEENERYWKLRREQEKIKRMIKDEKRREEYHHYHKNIKGFFERLEDLDDDLTFPLFFNVLSGWVKDMAFTITFFSIIIMVVIIVVCCKKQDDNDGNSRSETKSSEENNNKEDTKEDVVEKHAHAISHSR